MSDHDHQWVYVLCDEADEPTEALLSREPYTTREEAVAAGRKALDRGEHLYVATLGAWFVGRLERVDV